MTNDKEHFKSRISIAGNKGWPESAEKVRLIPKSILLFSNRIVFPNRITEIKSPLLICGKENLLLSSSSSFELSSSELLLLVN